MFQQTEERTVIHVIQSIRQTEAWSDYLTLLYRPLIGTSACMLYQILHAASKSRTQQIDLEDLLALAMLNEGQYTEARKRLEKYELVRSASRRFGQEWIIFLEAPLDPQSFLLHETFGRLLFEAVSSAGFERIRRLYGLDFVYEEYLEQSETLKFDELDATWTWTKEKALADSLPQADSLRQYPFDWALFFRNQERTIPERLRTRDNLVRIARLANVHGIDEKQMRIKVFRSVREEKTRIDFDFLESELESDRIVRKQADPNDYNAPAASFLLARSKGSSVVMPNEARTLNWLSDKLNFANEVINTLIEYCMNETNGEFRPSYIQAVGNNWARKGIDTRKKALEHIEQEKNRSYSRPAKKEDRLPDWYADTEEGEATPEQIEEAMAAARRLRERREEISRKDNE